MSKDNNFYWMEDKKRDKAQTAGYTAASQKGYYNSPFWRQQRLRQLLIKPVCQHCEQRGRAVPAKIVDHIKPVPASASFLEFMQLSGLDNLQSLCEFCHRVKTGRERNGKKQLTPEQIKNNMKKFEK